MKYMEMVEETKNKIKEIKQEINELKENFDDEIFFLNLQLHLELIRLNKLK